MDRRASQDDPTQRPLSTLSVVESDFAETDNDNSFGEGVGNGFRPDTTVTGSHIPEGVVEDVRRRSINAKVSGESSTQLTNARSSMFKAPVSQFSSIPALPDTDAGRSSEPTRRPAPAAHRESTTSTSSFVTDARSSMAAGPSHPYGMYPQGVNYSNNATPALPPQHQGQSPAHPYGMYPQNVEEPPEPVVPQQSIPVGFSGVATGYQRRIGPDGEEQDIVGPDGHTEQLPPYSRYPVDAPKTFVASSEMPSTSTSAVAPAATGSPASASASASASADRAASTDDITPTDPAPIPTEPPPPLGRREDLFDTLHQSRNERISTSNRTSQRSLPGPSQALSLASSSEQELKGEDLHGRPRRSWLHRRVVKGRVPVWLVLLMLIVVIIFAIILGAAVGTVFSKARKAEAEATAAEKAEQMRPSLYGATEITTPTSVPPLPTGVWSVPIHTPEEKQTNCIAESNELNAWDCIIDGPPMQLTVVDDRRFPKGQGVMLEPSKPASDPPSALDLQYGVQAPNVNLGAVILVSDLDARARGAAWHMQTRYNKLIIVRENDVPDGSSSSKRDLSFDASPPRRGDFHQASEARPDQPVGDNFKRRQALNAGEQPWFCYWNETFVEIYMYPYQESQTASQISSRRESASSTSTPTPTFPFAEAAVTPPPGSQKRNEYRPPPFPYVIKIEERRIPGSPSAVCRQMKILDNGQVVPADRGDGELIEVSISESDPSYPAYAAAEATSSNRQTKKRSLMPFHRRDEPSDGCHCQWVMQ